ncbi:MAG: hypothetical protein JXR41_15200 [Bacteroidales bacterium]|nr:hypothetical protein [Bacteroidales bacterium]MBN2764439.1 hypothetical protein [Bacteroidales bacterium]
MKKTIEDIIEKLKKQVRHNLIIINQNENIISDLSNHPDSVPQMAAYRKYYEENKNLLAENNDFTNLQLTLFNFLKKYRHSELLNDETSLDEVDTKQDPEYVFELTVTGKIPFNHKHPFFENKDFFSQLLMHFEKTEQYEKCKELIEVKKVLR